VRHHVPRSLRSRSQRGGLEAGGNWQRSQGNIRNNTGKIVKRGAMAQPPAGHMTRPAQAGHCWPPGFGRRPRGNGHAGDLGTCAELPQGFISSAGSLRAVEQPWLGGAPCRPVPPVVARQLMRDRSPSVEVRHLPGTQAGCRSLNARICRTSTPAASGEVAQGHASSGVAGVSVRCPEGPQIRPTARRRCGLRS
jgi:hypothetical protein